MHDDLHARILNRTDDEKGRDRFLIRYPRPNHDFSDQGIPPDFHRFFRMIPASRGSGFGPHDTTLT